MFEEFETDDAVVCGAVEDDTGRAEMSWSVVMRGYAIGVEDLVYAREVSLVIFDRTRIGLWNTKFDGERKRLTKDCHHSVLNSVP